MFRPSQPGAPEVLNWPGPVGLGSTQTEARSNLLNSLREIAASRSESGQSMPRPGTGLPIELADTNRVNADPDLLEEFIVHVLGFGRDDPVFVSDLSSISDFVDDEEEVTRIRNRIQEHFGVEVKEGGRILIADVLDQVRERMGR